MSIDEVMTELSALRGRTQNILEDYKQRIPEDEELTRFYIKARMNGDPFDFHRFAKWLKVHKAMGINRREVNIL